MKQFELQILMNINFLSRRTLGFSTSTFPGDTISLLGIRDKGVFISSISTLKTHLLEDFLPRGLTEYAPVIHQRAEKNISAQSSVFGRCELEREVGIKK